MAALGDGRRTSALLAKVTYMAHTRYGIRSEDAHEVAHQH